MIEGLVSERQSLYVLARDDIARAWGQARTVGGPILVVPFTYTRDVPDSSFANAERHTITIKDELYVLPEYFEIRGTADAEERRRGIYKIPVYTARLGATGRFPPVALDSGEYPDLAMLWEQAVIALPITDARYVREPIVLASGNGTTA